MPARKKSLLDLVEDKTFVARKHADLLDSPDEPALPWKSLETIRAQFRAADNEFDRRRFRLAFEQAIPTLHARRARAGKPMQEALEKLGPPGSAQQLKAFFPAFLRWPDGSPFRLDPYQELTIDLGWRRDKHDRRIFKEIGEGIPRGCGKTPFWSGIGTHATLAGENRPKVFQTSGAGDQAKLGLDYVSNWIDEDERLRRWLRASSTKISRRDGRGEYSIMKASGSLGHGRKPDIGLADEFWTIETSVQEKTITALETAIFKLPDAFWAWISTAGYKKDTLLGRAYDSALKLPHVERHNDGFHIRAWDEESGRLFLWWGLPEDYPLDLENDAEMLRVIRLCNPASWVDHRELLRALKRALSKGPAEVNEWIRFNLNGWTKTEAGWLPAGCWRGLRVDSPLPPRSDIWVAVDAAKTRDTTAVCWAGRLPNGRILLQVRVWAARDNAPHHVLVPGGRIDNRLSAAFIRDELAKTYNVREVVADPKYWDVLLWELGDEGFLTSEFNQNGVDMRAAETHFYERSIAAEVAWYDKEGVFAQHVEAAAGIPTAAGWHVFNPDKNNPIDALTAAIMARERCSLGGRRRTSIYESRGMLFLDAAGAEPSPELVDDDEELTEAELARLMRQNGALPGR